MIFNVGGRRLASGSAVLFSVCAGVATLSVGLVIAVLSPADWFSFALADGLLITTTVGVLVLNSRLGKDAFSPLALTAIFYLFAFGVGGIYFWVSPGQYAQRYSPSDLTQAVLLANVGWLCLVGGYLLNPFKPIHLILPPFPRSPTSASVLWTIGPLLVVGWTARLGLVATDRYFLYAPSHEVVSTGSSWFVSVAALLPTLAAAFVGVRSFTSRVSQRRIFRRLYWALLAIEVAWYVPSGARTNVIGLGLMAAIVAYYGRDRRIPWRSILVSAALLAFILFPLALEYRDDKTLYRENPSLALSRAAEETFGGGTTGFLGSGFTATFTRFSDVTSLALISSRERVPLGGSPMRTIRWIPETFVPRAILRSKEDPGRIGNEFGAAYGLTAAGAGTSIAMTQLGEVYLGFGLLGILIGMPLIGGFYRMLGDYFSERRRDGAILAVYAVTAWQLINGQETIIALGLIAIFKVMLVFALMIIVTTAIQRRWGTSGVPARLRETAA